MALQGQMSAARHSEPARDRSVSALDERVRERDAEAALGVGQSVVLAVVAVALGVREDHDAVGGEGGQRVLDRDRGLALAGVAGGVDALLLEALDGLLLRRPRPRRSPRRSRRPRSATLDWLVAGETTSTSAPSTSSPSAERSEVGVDRLRREDEQLHARSRYPRLVGDKRRGDAAARRAGRPRRRRRAPCRRRSRAPRPRCGGRCDRRLRPRALATTRASCSGPKRSSTGLASITPSV